MSCLSAHEDEAERNDVGEFGRDINRSCLVRGAAQRERQKAGTGSGQQGVGEFEFVFRAWGFRQDAESGDQNHDTDRHIHAEQPRP